MAEQVFAPTALGQDSPCRVRHVVTDDADCLAGSISGWSQRYEQLNCGHFQGSLSELCVGTVQVFIEQTSHALHQSCTVPADSIWFGLPSSETRSVRINGAEVPSGRISVHRGGACFDLVTPDALQFWGIVVKENMLLDYARQFERENWLAGMLEQSVMGVAEEKKRVVQHACSEMLLATQRAKPLAQATALTTPLGQALSEHALSALFSLFNAAEPISPARGSTRQRQRLVKRADDFVRAHSDRLITVSELCSTLSSSRRALQISFQDVLGISPHAYIRAVSLNGVRRHLNDPNSPHLCVQDAAAAFGFWHMSQFASDYRQLFGELPSETLKRRDRSPLK